MIHYYFGSKARLYRRVVELEIADLFRILRDKLRDGLAPQDVLAGLPGVSLELHARHPELVRIMLRAMIDDASRLKEMVREMGESGPLGVRRALADLVASAQEAGYGAGLPPAHLLAIFFSVGNGLMAFAPLIEEIFGLDMRDPAAAAAVGRSAGVVVRRALAPVEEV